MSPSLRLSLSAALAIILSACGGSDPTNPPPPPPAPPAVASVTVSPDTGTVAPGGTLQLAVTLRDAAGQAITGRTVTWASSDLTRASVSSTGLVTGAADGAVVITATSEGKGGDAHLTIAFPPPALVVPTFEAARAASARLGVDGGSITATRSDGAILTLAIPGGALLDSATITVTPVLAIGNLPLSGGLAGAVKFGPEGLRLAVPASLTIDLPSAPLVPAGMRLVGFGYGDGGGNFHLAPAVLSGRTLTLTVPHFSGAGGGFATVSDVSTLARSSQPGGEIGALNQLLGLEGTPNFTAVNVGGVFRVWFTTSIRTALAGAATDQQTVNAISEYGTWLTLIQNDPGLATIRTALQLELGGELTEADSLAAAALRRGITRAETACSGAAQVADGLTLASNMLYWQSLAERYRLANSGYGLSAAAIGVIVDGCVGVTASSSFPSSVLPGQVTPLTVQANVRLRTVLVQGNTPIVLSVTAGGGAYVSPSSGPVNATGGFTAGVTSPSTVNVLFDVTATACVDPVRYPLLRHLCGTAIATSRVIPSGGGSGACVKTAPSYLFYGGSSSATPWSYEPGSQLLITQAEADSVQKAELVLIGSVDGAGGETVELKCMSTPRAVRMTTSTAGALKLSALTEVGNAGEMGAGVTIDGNPGLTKITLGAATINGYLIIRDNPLLTDITGIAAGMIVTNQTSIGNNPNLCQSQVDALLARITTARKQSYFNKGC
jgi:hypothetical protein